MGIDQCEKHGVEQLTEWVRVVKAESKSVTHSNNKG